MTTNLTSKPLSRKQIAYATERCKRIATKKKHDLEDLARSERHAELTDFDKVQMIRRGEVSIDPSLLKLPKQENRRYYAPQVIDCADFSSLDKEIKDHNTLIDKRLKKAQAEVERRAESILDRFELGEPSEALRLLTEFDAQEFTL